MKLSIFLESVNGSCLGNPLIDTSVRRKSCVFFDALGLSLVRFTVGLLFGLLDAMSFLLAALGGALGGACRYLLSNAVAAYGPKGFPWGTLAVNALGSFLLGLSLGAGLSAGEGSLIGKAFIAVGFCGGLTTFSTFSLEALELASRTQWGRFGAKLAISLPFCMFLVWLGSVFGGRLFL